MRGTRKYLPAIFGLLFAIAVAGMQMARGFALPHSASDGCFAAGVMLIGIGVLRFAANQGCFDLAFYGLRKVLTIRQKKYEKFHEYQKRKQVLKKETLPFLLPGAAFLVLSAVFLVFLA